MIIDLKKPPYFLTLDSDRRTLEEGVEVTPAVRRETQLNRGAPLPDDLKRLTVGHMSCSCSSWIEISLDAPSKPDDRALVWTGEKRSFGTSGWAVLPFALTTAEELARLYGPHPEDWVAGRSTGVPHRLTPELSVIVHDHGSNLIYLDVVETASVEKMFRAVASETAARFLAERASLSPR